MTSREFKNPERGKIKTFQQMLSCPLFNCSHLATLTLLCVECTTSSISLPLEYILSLSFSLNNPNCLRQKPAPQSKSWTDLSHQYLNCFYLISLWTWQQLQRTGQEPYTCSHGTFSLKPPIPSLQSFLCWKVHQVLWINQYTMTKLNFHSLYPTIQPN